jgi:hypothetical protein
MDLIQLKVPPEQLARMANAIERDMRVNPDPAEVDELQKIHTWLRYRHSKWLARRPAKPAA